MLDEQFRVAGQKRCPLRAVLQLAQLARLGEILQSSRHYPALVEKLLFSP
jgi:hypothetical protein